MSLMLKLFFLILLFGCFFSQLPFPDSEPTESSSETPAANEESTSNSSDDFSEETHTDPIEDLPTETDPLEDLPLIDTTPESDNSLLIFENMTRGENRSYTFEVFNAQSFQKIAIFVSPYKKKQQPGSLKIFLTFKNHTPNDSFHDQVCERVLLGFSSPCLVTIPYKESDSLSASKLKMLVLCESENCNLKLRILHEQEIFLQPETKEIYSFDREEAEIFSFEIPKTFARIVFSIHFKNLAENLYEKQINQVEEVLYFTTGEPTIIRGNNHIVALFNRTDSTLCETCNLTFYMNWYSR